MSTFEKNFWMIWRMDWLARPIITIKVSMYARLFLISMIPLTLALMAALIPKSALTKRMFAMILHIKYFRKGISFRAEI